MKVGIIGVGWFGREAHLRNLLKIPGIEVSAVSGRSESSREAAREIAGPALRVFETADELLALPELDAVIISVPNHLHCEVASAALRAGKHVLCEKPLGLSIAECDQLIRLADEHRRVLQIGHEMRFQSLYVQMESMIRNGVIGDARIAWCREYRGPMRPGWRSRASTTGGLFLEKNCHHFDLFHWFFKSRPLKVSAFGGRDVLTDQELLDNAQVLIEYEHGRRAILEICLFAPAGGDCEIGLAGTAGRLDSWNQQLTLRHTDFKTREQRTHVLPEPDEEAVFRDAAGRVDRGILQELRHFADCCRTGTRPLTDAHTARFTTAVCLAAEHSVRLGATVLIEDVLEGRIP